MKPSVHDRIEAIAGAIALGEASDEERRLYREHIASCSPCLRSLGGECEIERVACTVASARDTELWQPDLRDVVGAKLRRRSRALAWAAKGLGVAAAACAGIYFTHAGGVVPVKPAPPAAVSAAASGYQPVKFVAAAQPSRRLIVEHNVVQIARAPVVEQVVVPPVFVRADARPRPLIAITVHPNTPPQSTRHANVPPWRADSTSWRTVARTTTTSVTETAPQSLTQRAESIQVTPNYTREVAPVGGATAINPQPPMIAYDEGAVGTTVFEVLVDDRGVPTRCVITKPAGFPVLDEAVCKAAMKTRYTPKVVGGRAVPGVYHDAFTFQMSDQTSSNIEGVPLIHDQRRVHRPVNSVLPQSSLGDSGDHD